MPRVILTEHDREAVRLRSNLKLMQGKHSNAEMGRVIGRSDVTYAARLKNPETLTLRELRMLCAYFRIDRAKFLLEELKIG